MFNALPQTAKARNAKGLTVCHVPTAPPYACTAPALAFIAQVVRIGSGFGVLPFGQGSCAHIASASFAPLYKPCSLRSRFRARP